MKTPYTEDGLRRFDHLPAAEAVAAAWVWEGPQPDWHRQTQQVRDAMPVLARAIERLVASHDPTLSVP